MQRIASSTTAHRSLLLAIAAMTLLAACGSSDSSGIDAPSVTDDTSDAEVSDAGDQLADSPDEYNGNGTISVDGNTYTFGLKCTFGEETMNESVSIGIVGENDTVGMSFTQMYGFDFSTGQYSADVPEDHSISIYEMPEILLRYEYLSLTTKELLDVSGRTVSGTVTFVVADSEGETFGQPTAEGDVELVCD